MAGEPRRKPQIPKLVPDEAGGGGHVGSLHYPLRQPHGSFLAASRVATCGV